MCYNQHKGVKNAYTYIYYIKIGKGCCLVMVVDLVNIGIGWRCIWPYILIAIKNTGICRCFFLSKQCVWFDIF